MCLSVSCMYYYNMCIVYMCLCVMCNMYVHILLVCMRAYDVV